MARTSLEQGTEEVEYPRQHPLEGRQITKDGEIFTIEYVHADDAFKPGLGPGIGTYEPAIVFSDKDGNNRWGPLDDRSEEGIVSTLNEHGYTLVPTEAE